MNKRRHWHATKLRISENRKGKCVGPENPMYGKKHTDEAKAKISETRKSRLAAGTIVGPTARKYNVYDRHDRLVLTHAYKRDIMDKLKLSDNQYRTLLNYFRSTNWRKPHKRTGLLFVRLNNER